MQGQVHRAHVVDAEAHVATYRHSPNAVPARLTDRLPRALVGWGGLGRAVVADAHR
jgi:hypothetical protein